jgi:hypothetical protein
MAEKSLDEMAEKSVCELFGHFWSMWQIDGLVRARKCQHCGIFQAEYTVQHG